MPMTPRSSPPPTPNLPFFTRPRTPEPRGRDDDRGEGPSIRPVSAIVLGGSSSSSGNGAPSTSSLSLSDRGRVASANAAVGGSSIILDPPPSAHRSRSASAGYSAATRKDTDSDELLSDPESRLSFGFSEGEDDYELDDDLDASPSEPLVPSSSRRRRRTKWDDDPGERSLFELVAPLILAHPLALYPALSAVPAAFLPAGVALFVPLLCIIAALSACAHVVIVYLAWYLKVRTFEDVFASCAGERFGKYAAVVGRAFVLFATIGSTVGWLGTLFPLLEPLATTYLPDGFLQWRLTWTVAASLVILPAVVPSRTFRSLRGTPIVLALLLPIMTFIVIGRTVEVKKAADEAGADLVSAAKTAATAAVDAAVAAVSQAAPPAEEGAKDLARRGLRGLVSPNAGWGITMMTMFFSPHLQTLPIHGTLRSTNRQKFGAPVLAAGLILVLLSIPLALVPYYLLPEGSTVFTQLPDDDGWVNFARVLMAAIILGSITMWILRGRDTILAALDVERGAERYKAGRWVGLGMWAVVTALACIGGVIADKIELLGVMATIAVSWLMPSLFFIITFHVRSPLAIIFPSNAPAPAAPEDDPTPAARTLRGGSGNGHIRTASLQDPSTDDLLYRKERQLQKRRLGRRLWQDLIVYVGILPIGCVTLLWCVGSFVGLW